MAHIPQQSVAETANPGRTPWRCHDAALASVALETSVSSGNTNDAKLRQAIKQCSDTLLSVATGLRHHPSRHDVTAVRQVLECAQRIVELTVLLDLDTAIRHTLATKVISLHAEMEGLRAALRDSERHVDQVRRLALHDPLTGLPNRIAFAEALQNALHASGTPQRPFALLFIDLDGFKSINDTLGHSVGDELLRIIGARLAHATRASDAVCRHGGDEFLCLLSGAGDEREVLRIAGNLFDAILGPYSLGTVSQEVRPSIGIAMFPRDGATAEQLITNADTAMYWAKRRGQAFAVFGHLGAPVEVVLPSLLARAPHRTRTPHSPPGDADTVATPTDQVHPSETAVATVDPVLDDPPQLDAQVSPVKGPGTDECEVMEQLGITYSNGVYRYHQMLYDHLYDAIVCARAVAKRSSQ
ncbi:GGDEF domain-containing protein [Tahibacter amnicola]|uniref:GGDEF domain-containing protein n=1 Tax=Tahibacter amnicola TaxID=2976241 RepID=A0ABY6BL34_9GAMM|nr:GGDEF domain-containing protein [Tahibacter amnicola]UXI70336.1 GGDEF domain-containing protein [Tahibacter amnicola]